MSSPSVTQTAAGTLQAYIRKFPDSWQKMKGLIACGQLETWDRAFLLKAHSSVVSVVDYKAIEKAKFPDLDTVKKMMKTRDIPNGQQVILLEHADGSCTVQRISILTSDKLKQTTVVAKEDMKKE